MRRNRIRDGCAVETSQLADMLKNFRDEWNRERPSTAGRFRDRSLPEQASPIGAMEWLSSETGIPFRNLENIFFRRKQLTSLGDADAIVTALSRPEAFHDGTLNVVENPSASRAARRECCGGSTRDSLTG